MKTWIFLHIMVFNGLQQFQGPNDSFSAASKLPDCPVRTR